MQYLKFISICRETTHFLFDDGVRAQVGEHGIHQGHFSAGQKVMILGCRDAAGSYSASIVLQCVNGLVTCITKDGCITKLVYLY